MTTALLVLAILVVVLMAVLLADRPVNRDRIARLAAQHHLTVTPDNGPQLVAYLALTRRWRAAGLAAAVAAYLLPELRAFAAGSGSIRVVIDLFLMLAGWFAGALAAEGRLAQRAQPGRAASLVRRTLHQYVPQPLVWSVPVAGALLLGLALLAGAAPDALPEATRRPLWLAGAVLLPLFTWLTARRVVGRAQPVAPPDILAADNALRSRSLHVIFTSSLVLLLYCIVDALGPLAARELGENVSLLLDAFLAVALPWCGWRLATAAWPAPARPPIPAESSA